MVEAGVGSPDERWLASTWPFVHAQLPASPAAIVEIGCGPLGGFIPALRTAGYDALGIDPDAPEGSEYAPTEFEQHELAGRVEVVIACTSLHHVNDLDDVLGRIAGALVPGGRLVVVEWAWELFDERTARWCFDRLAATAEDDGDDLGWLHRHRDRWATSGQSWESYFQAWARSEHLHTGQEIVRVLEARYESRLLSRGPYFFAELQGVTPADEQHAIDDERIQATGIRYVGQSKTARGRSTGRRSG